MPNVLLKTDHLSRSFGGLQAVRDVSIAVEEGSFHSVIGPNGAGKTTFFNMISGAIKPSSGKVFFAGNEITGQPLHRMIHLGIGRAYQITSLFPSLTVAENVRLAAQARGRDTFKFWQHSDRFQRYHERAQTALKLVGLRGVEHMLASALPHGDKRKLELALLLASEPRLLLLDEPTAGMAANQVPELIEIIQQLRQSGQHTIILVEHRMDVVMSISDQITVMHGGSVLAEGTPQAIAADTRVQQAYLGELYDDVLSQPHEVAHDTNS